MFGKAIVRLFPSAAAVLVVMLIVSMVHSQDKAKPADGAAMDPAAMMAEYVRLSQPTAEHKLLGASAGEWDAVTKAWQPDGSPCGSGSGIMRNKMILGGRYLEMNFDGAMDVPGGGKAPFHGKGLVGYDRGKKKYVSVWIDDMSTGMMITEGTAEGDVMTGEGEFTDPMTGKPTRVKDIATRIDDSHRTYELHMTGPDGTMYKAMEITYAKKGG